MFNQFGKASDEESGGFRIITRKELKRKNSYLYRLNRRNGMKIRKKQNKAISHDFKERGESSELMINGREKRAPSERFKSYLEVIKGNKDFYIEDEISNEDGNNDIQNISGDVDELQVLVSSESEHLIEDGFVSVISDPTNVPSEECVLHIDLENCDNAQMTSDKHYAINTCSENKVPNFMHIPFDESIQILNDENEKETDLFKDLTIECTTESFLGTSDISGETFNDIKFINKDKTIIQQENLRISSDLLLDNNLSFILNKNSSPLVLENDVHGLKSIEYNQINEDIATENRKQYRCKLCSNTFSNLDEAKKHAKTAHSVALSDVARKSNINGNFKCPECRREFPTDVGRNKHYILMHIKNGPVSCSECSLSFNSFRPLEKHLQEIHDKNCTTACDLCDKEFVLELSLEHHKNISHRDRSKLGSLNEYYNHVLSRKKAYKCHICSQKLWGLKTFQNHYAKVHNEFAFNCKLCKFKSMSPLSLKKHLASVHQEHGLSIFQCSVCKVGYGSPVDLEEHYLCAHNYESLFQCSFCGESFACLEMLRFHKGKHKAYPCKICPLGFNKPESLEVHMNAIHSYDLNKVTEGSFEIGSLKKEIDSSKSDTTLHLNSVFTFTDEGETSKILEINTDGSILVQEGDTPGKSASPEDRTHHLHNSQDGQLKALDTEQPLKDFKLKDLPRKIECPVCNKLLTTKFINTHMLTHRGTLPHKCTRCPKAYAQGTLLRKHMKNKHYEDFLKLGNKRPKKYKSKCDFCDLEYENIYLLEEHLWIHMTEKKYNCESCRIKFGMKVNWIEHYKSHYFDEEKLCHRCSRPFKSIGFYREHLELCETDWTCKTCGLKCGNSEVYRKHKKVENECGKLYSQNKKSKQVENEYVSNQNYDNLSGELLARFKKNAKSRNESSSTMHACNVCDLSFPRENDFRTHISKHFLHKMKCPNCDAVHFSRESLDNHIAVYHFQLSQHPIVCPYCSDIFEKQIDLKQHLKEHNSNAIFVCQASGCHKIFENESKLNFHTRKFHPKINFVCNICFRNFLVENDLIKHVELHNSSSELYCGKCFFTSQDEGEMHWHTCEYDEVIAYECSVCKYRCRQKMDMISHVTQKHNLYNHIEKIFANAYKCMVCEKVYLSQGVLRKHLEQHVLNGVPAKGITWKISLSYPFGNDNSLNNDNETWNIDWEKVLATMKVQVLFHNDSTDTKSKLRYTAVNWQCPTCYYIAKTEDNMRKHLASTASCFSAVIQNIRRNLILPDLGYLSSIIPKSFGNDVPNPTDNGHATCNIENNLYGIKNLLYSDVPPVERIGESNFQNDDQSNFETNTDLEISDCISFDISEADFVTEAVNTNKSEVPGIIIQDDNDICLFSSMTDNQDPKVYQDEGDFEVLQVTLSSDEMSNNSVKMLKFV